MELSAFKAPIDQRYFEDYNKGARFEYGPILVEEAEIISFTRRFDPLLALAPTLWEWSGFMHRSQGFEPTGDVAGNATAAV